MDLLRYNHRIWENSSNCKNNRKLTKLKCILWEINYEKKVLTVIHVNLPAGAFFSRIWGSLPSTFKIFRPWKKSSTIKSWPTFCDQYFWKFPIWNSRADEKHREIRMVKVFKRYPVIDLFDTFTGKLGHGDQISSQKFANLQL